MNREPMTDRHTTAPPPPTYHRIPLAGDREIVIHMREQWSQDEIDDAVRKAQAKDTTDDE